MALSEAFSRAREFVGEHTHRTYLPPEARLARDIKRSLRQAKKGREIPIARAGADEYFFHFEIDDPLKIDRLIMEDSMYGVWNETIGRSPTEFSWDPDRHTSNEDGEIDVAIHKTDNPKYVTVESVIFRNGARVAAEIAVAERNKHYDELLSNPVHSDHDQELSEPLTQYLKPQVVVVV